METGLSIEELSKRYEDVISSLRMLLNPHRFKHTLAVAETAYRIASATGSNAERAYLAGLLHDCAKHLSDSELIEAATNHGETLGEQELKYPNNLLHSKVGSFRAREVYGIDDSEILSSIYYHTTAKPDMSLLEKIIYVSDFIEPGRKIDMEPSLDKLRELALIDIEKTFLIILEHTTAYLIDTYKEDICKDSLLAYYHYIKQEKTND